VRPRAWALVLALAATLAPAAPAQSPGAPRRLSLEEALGLALPASEAVGLARVAVQRARGQERQARSELFPQLTGSASYNRLLKSQYEGFASGGGDDSGNPDPAPSSCEVFTPIPGDPITARLDSLERAVRCASRANPFGNLGSLPFGRANTWNLGLSASQTLFAGGRLFNGIRAAEAGRRAAEIGVTAAQAQLMLDVVEAYADAALADRMVVIAQAGLDQADTTLVQTALRREVGTAPEFDLLRATVARDNLRPQLIAARSQRDIAQFRLRQLLNLPLHQALELTTPLDDTAPAATPTLAARIAQSPDTAAERRATVRQAAEAVTAQEALLRVAGGESLPAVSVTSQYGRVAYPSGALPNWNEFYTNWSLSVGLQVPLFTGGRLRGSREVARAGLADASLRLRQSSEGAALDARSTQAQLDGAVSAWDASAGTVAQATRAYAIAEVRFREGLSTQTELLDARLALQQAEANRATAARDLLVARVRLALIADLPLGGGSATMPASPSPAARSVAPATVPSTGPGIP